MNSKPVTHKKKTTLKLKFIALDNKIKIFDRLSSGDKAGLIEKILGLNESTIRTIKQNESKIRNSLTAGSSIRAKRIARVRNI